MGLFLFSAVQKSQWLAFALMVVKKPALTGSLFERASFIRTESNGLFLINKLCTSRPGMCS